VLGSGTEDSDGLRVVGDSSQSRIANQIGNKGRGRESAKVNRFSDHSDGLKIHLGKFRMLVAAYHDMFWPLATASNNSKATSRAYS
jgi:hypothetical protein